MTTPYGPGDAVLLRSVYRGRVRWAVPHRFVGTDDGRLLTTEWALDIWVEPDGAWSWKDEGDFAEAIELGVFDDEAAGAVRAEGERVVADKPWPTGWEDWRPPDVWEPLPLPPGWAATGGPVRAEPTTVRRAAPTDGMILNRGLGFTEEGCAAPSCVHEGASELAMVLQPLDG